MKRVAKTEITWEIYGSLGEMEEKDKELMQMARNACDNAYAPYSEFFVGAAVRLSDGRVEIGSNQENAAYPSGLCAERVALFGISARLGDVEVETIAVAARRSAPDSFVPVTPCGSCRQVMAEYEFRQEKPIRIIMEREDEEMLVSSSVADLLPLGFSKKSL
ncbi:cytidine deaminase [Fulvitalea axinellae]|uniref:Cytidine deaminase n=1 Tax=Fulvitalea axinellae TaxID=1182444 RepID=A0AAU9D6Z5_9BACT|nr:cytidine deaminase [Fulvitalea axinellae]